MSDVAVDLTNLAKSHDRVTLRWLIELLSERMAGQLEAERDSIPHTVRVLDEAAHRIRAAGGAT